MSLREKIAKEIAFAGRCWHDVSRGAQDFWDHTEEGGRRVFLRQADAILALVREGVKPLEWEHVTLNVYNAIFAGCLYRKIGRSDGTWALRIDTARYDTKTANSEAAIDKYARENVAAHIFSALGMDT